MDKIATGAVVEVGAVVGMPDTLAEVAIMADLITVAILDTITGGMHQEGPYSELFSVEWLLEASSVHTGGLTTRYRYLQPIMLHTINIHMLHLRT
jgi:hypothetical protein